MSINSQRVMDSTKKRKVQLADILGGKCIICGFDLFPEGLDFHHVDPSTKKFQLSGSNLSRSLDTQYAELKKCILVCANCHRGIHYGHCKVPSNWRIYFNEEKAQKYKQMLIPKEYKCITCGKLVTKSAKQCSKCAKESLRVISRPSREELKAMIRSESFVAIAKRYNVSDNTIRKWCKAENLPSKKRDIQEFSDSEWKKI